MLVGFRVWGKTARYQKSAIKTWLKINVHSYQKITRHFNGFHNICPTKNSWLIKRTEKLWKISLLKTSISKTTAPENSRIKSPGDAIARNQGNTSTNHQGLGCHPQGATWPSWLAKKVDLKSLVSKPKKFRSEILQGKNIFVILNGYRFRYESHESKLCCYL